MAETIKNLLTSLKAQKSKNAAIGWGYWVLVAILFAVSFLFSLILNTPYPLLNAYPRLLMLCVGVFMLTFGIYVSSKLKGRKIISTVLMFLSFALIAILSFPFLLLLWLISRIMYAARLRAFASHADNMVAFFLTLLLYFVFLVLLAILALQPLIAIADRIPNLLGLEFLYIGFFVLVLLLNWAAPFIFSLILQGIFGTKTSLAEAKTNFSLFWKYVYVIFALLLMPMQAACTDEKKILIDMVLYVFLIISLIPIQPKGIHIS